MFNFTFEDTQMETSLANGIHTRQHFHEDEDYFSGPSGALFPQGKFVSAKL